MNLDQIETKCFILALFIRDDGERFLLGSRAYEFVDSQLHFVANSYQNDIVEVQGNDGVMLAGQVRRGTSQPFDGYIGDQTVDRATIEQYRRDFMKFFRKNHYYKVVYVFPDGSAVQRRNGFIVEAPEVKELYQLFPQYHVSMNFEDINYYVYEEDSDGKEIYGESAILKIATSATGGLIWEEGTESEISGEGSQFTLQDTIDGNVLDSVQLKGDTTQQTYSGYQLLQADGYGTEFSDTTFWRNLSSAISSTPLGNGWARFTSASNSSKNIFPYRSTGFNWENSTTYTLICEIGANADTGRLILTQPSNSDDPFSSYSLVYGESSSDVQVSIEFGNNSSPITTVVVATTKNNPSSTIGLRTFFAGTFASGGNVDLRITAIKGDHTSDWQNYIWEPYTGGIPAPNPDYPQEVQVVTGEQVVTITDGQGQSQEYEVDLGSIELCKIGTYQDYIYKSGDDWYVHKAVRHLQLPISGMNNQELYPGWTGQTQFKADLGTTSGGQIYTDTSMVTNIAGLVTSSSRSVTKNFNGNNALLLLPTDYYGSDHNQTYWKANYANLVVDFYYGINGTITDTQITNTDLIAQLNALATATTYDGQTVFTVTSANQLAILDVTVIARTGGGVVWDNYGAEWEEGTGGGPTMVNVDSIDNVYPVLTLTGPAVNPQISVLTTNTTLSYSGTVTASQELKIDMFNKTATLNGASVVGNVSGDWVYLKPGVNRITYTTNNADAPDSTIWWQEIVG